MNNKNLKLKILSAVMSATMLFGTGAIGLTVSAASQTNNSIYMNDAVSITDSTVPKMSNGKKISEKFNGSTKNAVVYSIEENSSITFNIKTNATSPMYEFAIRNVNDSKYTVVKQFSTKNSYKFTLKAGQYIVRTRIKDKSGNIMKRYYNIDSKLSLKSSTIVSSKDSTLSNIVANEKTTFNVNYSLDKYKILYKKSINSSWKTIKSFDNDKHSITFQTTGSYDVRLVYIRDDGSTATRDYKITPISKDSLRTLSLKFTGTQFIKDSEVSLMELTLKNTKGKVIRTAKVNFDNLTDATYSAKFKNLAEDNYVLTINPIMVPNGYSTTPESKNYKINMISEDGSNSSKTIRIDLDNLYNIHKKSLRVDLFINKTDDTSIIYNISHFSKLEVTLKDSKGKVISTLDTNITNMSVIKDLNCVNTFNNYIICKCMFDDISKGTYTIVVKAIKAPDGYLTEESIIEKTFTIDNNWSCDNYIYNIGINVNQIFSSVN